MTPTFAGTGTVVWQNRPRPREESRLPVRELPSDAQRAIEVALIQRVQAGDASAIGELYTRFGRPLYSLAYQVVRDATSAEDIVQEVFLALWRDASRFDPSKGSAAGWLFSLARHKAIDLLRRETTARSRSVDVDLTLEPAGDDVEGETWWRIRRERVLAAMADLTDTQREAVELAFFAGLTHVEVADRLAIPLGTAKTRIRSGLLRLRDVLGDSVSDLMTESAR
jgi:RNA polymerase sigma-70 factor (ECF subfamily)